MQEEINFYLQEAEESMQKAIDFTVTALTKIRAGKANPSMLDGLSVDYYGARTPLSQVASVSTADARTIVVKPWEKSILQEIERAIINSDLGLNPQNDGEMIRLNIPSLTEERRRDLMKNAKAEGENGKIGIRNARKETNDALKKLQKDGASEDAVKRAEDTVQEMTNKFVAKVDSIIDAKEKDIMTV